MRYFFFKPLILISVFAIFIAACSSGQGADAEIPDSILNEERFTKLLVDFALAESASNINVKNVPAEKSDSAYAFNPLEENNISRSLYDSTVSFYSTHPALYKKIYENVLVELSKMQIKPDSVKAVPVLK